MAKREVRCFSYDPSESAEFLEKNWLKVYRPLLKKVTLLEAVFVCQLLNYRDFRAPRTVKKDGWFRVRIIDLEQTLGLSRESQARLFRAMDKLAWVSTRRAGMPPRRWVFVHKSKIIKDVKEVISSDKEKTLNEGTPDLKKSDPW